MPGSAVGPLLADAWSGLVEFEATPAGFGPAIGPERRALSGLAPQRCYASRYAGRACGAPLTLETCQPSGPDGEGQARGQARNARGEHGQPSEGCHPYSRFVSLETGEMPRLRLRRRPSRDIKNYPVSGYIYPPPAKAYVRSFPAGVS